MRRTVPARDVITCDRCSRELVEACPDAAMTSDRTCIDVSRIETVIGLDDDGKLRKSQCVKRATSAATAPSPSIAS